MTHYHVLQPGATTPTNPNPGSYFEDQRDAWLAQGETSCSDDVVTAIQGNQLPCSGKTVTYGVIVAVLSLLVLILLLVQALVVRHNIVTRCYQQWRLSRAVLTVLVRWPCQPLHPRVVAALHVCLAASHQPRH